MFRWLVLLLVLAASSVQAQNPSGWYVFQPLIGGPRVGAKPPWPAPNVQGIVLRIAANQIDLPVAQGVTYDWSAIDERLVELKRRNEDFTWQLQIYISVYYPQHWERKGAQTVSFRDAVGVRWRMLLPWDPVAQRLYRQLMLEAGKHYNLDPNLTLVHVTFPQAYSPEMHMPPEVIRLPGYATKIVAAYKQSIRAVAESFPSKAICLNLFNLTMNVNRQGPALTQLVATQAARAYGPRMHFQLNGWNAKGSFGNYDIFQLLVRLAKAGSPVGLEQVDHSGTARYGGTWSASLRRLSECQASYAIIYDKDQPRVTGWWADDPAR